VLPDHALLQQKNNNSRAGDTLEVIDVYHLRDTASKWLTRIRTHTIRLEQSLRFNA
jgi:hypothetical protein